MEDRKKCKHLWLQYYKTILTWNPPQPRGFYCIKCRQIKEEAKTK